MHVKAGFNFKDMQALASSKSGSNLVYAFEGRFVPVGYYRRVATS